MIFINIKNIHFLIALLIIVEVSCLPKISHEGKKTGNSVNKKSLNSSRNETKIDNDVKSNLARTGDDLEENDKLQQLDEEILDEKVEKNCWMKLKSKHFKAMDELDDQYFEARSNFQRTFDINAHGDFLLSGLLEQKGAADRAKHQAGGNVRLIPAGLNLGGYCMMRMPTSVLFFHRMKLRNQTRFRVNFLNVDLVNMELAARLSLNDLHLLGAYERASTDSNNPSAMKILPSFGEVQIMMKNVNYKLNGRLRLINKRFLIEHVNSEVITDEILMMYVNENKTTEATKIQRHNIEEFVSRMKCDLNLWLKDFFNDYLMYSETSSDISYSQDLLDYETKKTVLANQYADDAIDSIKRRLRKLQAKTVKLPQFSLYAPKSMQLLLYNGELRGLDSIYRRSVATTIKDGKVRKTDIIVGFSQLKVEYWYEGGPWADYVYNLFGKIIMSADELTAHLSISQIKEPPTLDVHLDDFLQTKPESITVQGQIARWMANLKPMLEHSVMAILSNAMMHNIKMMKSLTRCEPYIQGKDLAGDYDLEDDIDTSSTEKKAKKLCYGNDYGADGSNCNLKEDALTDFDYYNVGNDDEDDEDYKTVDNNSRNVPDMPYDANQDDSNIPYEDSKQKLSEDTDYFLTKNDSVEVEVPINGKVEKMKIKSYNEFKLKQIN